ncbi:tetratricopeptide repeat protein [Aquibacillus sediminis]|uniref:tetratricopeptide repeat protein n=1 Tax=Aquibacillus sediminis TaxID=2574734 RepID=UPI001107A8E4|nr:tetratricopeptide repeat protein [Aquibacillus sediminis]
MTNQMTNEQEQLLSLQKQIKQKIVNNDLNEIKTDVQQLELLLNYDDNIDQTSRFLALTSLAKFYKKSSNYDKSANYSRQALKIAKQMESDYKQEVVACYLDFSELERNYQQHANARKIVADLLFLLDKNSWQDPFTYGLTFRSLGHIFIDEEDYENGVKHLNKALNYLREAGSDTSKAVVQLIYELSTTYIKTEEYHQAIVLNQELLAAYKKQNDDASAAEVLLTIGEAYYYVDLKQARKNITEALERLNEIYQDKHLMIAKANLMLAELDENMSDFTRAVTYYQRALEQFKYFYDQSHFMIVYVYSKLGTLSMEKNELELAKDYLETGLELSIHFPKIRLQFLYALGKLYSGEKQYDRAFTVFQEFLDRLKQDDKQKTKAYADTLQAIAYNFIEQEKYNDAYSYYQQALELYKLVKLNCPEEKGLTFIRLAYCYENIDEKDITKAEECYEHGVKSIEKARNKELLEEALTDVINFYSRYPNDQKRKQFEDKLVKLQVKK